MQYNYVYLCTMVCKGANYVMKNFEEYKQETFEFMGMQAKVVFPDTADKERNWAFRMEYFGAFPMVEAGLLEKGYHVVYIQNENRWCMGDDLDRKHAFHDFVVSKYNLTQRCVPVGLSCGGLFAVKYAGKYPQDVAVLYLDAPVMNLLSCPCGLISGNTGLYEEFVKCTGLTVLDIINYREHPVDMIPVLINHNIPVILVCGDSDTTVPYVENGKFLYEQYTKANCKIKLILKEGVGHHPHGLDDPTEIVDFITENIHNAT